MDQQESELEVDAGPTERQLAIWDYLRTHSWKEATETYGLSSKRVVSVIAMRTALGLPWEEEHPGGAYPYLNYECVQRLLHLIDRYTAEHQALRT